jgi:tRNA A-37 threonylcarbamoyl transferase component Bud32
MLKSNRTEARRKSQLDFLKSGANIIIGCEDVLPVSLQELTKVDENHHFVERVFDGGLSAIVYKLNINGKNYNLKKKREKILVENVDGQTSFLNEVQRRQELKLAKEREPEMYNGIVNTLYANLHKGIFFSEWIEGEVASVYNKQIFRHLFQTMSNMEKIGIFENDPTIGNIVVKDDNITLFDFGYAYPFNPLKEINMEGFNELVFHAVERFESRAFMIHLLDIEMLIGFEQMLDLFRMEKEVALEVYNEKIEWLTEKKADEAVVDYYRKIVSRWKEALKNNDNLKKLFELEQFRSFLIDVVDDISGKSCNPDTLIKAEKICDTIRKNFDYLKANDAFFWQGEDEMTQEELIKKYDRNRQLVEKYQLKNLEGFYNWRDGRHKIIREHFVK